MFEKHEKWFVLGFIALAIYYFYKKGRTPSASQGAQQADPFYANEFANMGVGAAVPGSLVNQASEPGSVQPAQTSTPVVFRPAQPSTGYNSQLVSAGQFSWYPAPPVLRNAPSDYMMARSYLN